MTAVETGSDQVSLLAGQVALVTGATSGLGRNFAHVLSSHGARVAVAGRREDRLRDVVAESARWAARASAFGWT
jgi:NADP-dependent 3-hydroxy acid dehydrogenase YdfG